MLPVPPDLAALCARLRGLAPGAAAGPTPGDTSLRPAAVLVALVANPVPGVLLTRRATGLSSHAGQVALPGGRIDPGDASPEAAALREAEEEIGLPPSRVSLLGRLRPRATGTGFLVTPVTALVPGGLRHVPAPAEVDAVFELPLSVLLDPAAPRRRRLMRGERAIETWLWPHPEHEIWGATAAILADLAAALRGEAPP